MQILQKKNEKLSIADNSKIPNSNREIPHAKNAQWPVLNLSKHSCFATYMDHLSKLAVKQGGL
jgi:hypothetical protein